MTFIDSSTSSFEITTWHWDFGDGHSSNDHNITHLYTAPGTYEVCLTIHDNHDCNDTYCHAVVVQAVQSGCEAFFESEQTPGTLSVHFFDGSESNHDITSWSWTFGDGGTSDNHAPTHIYDQPGTYQVCLTIHDNFGCEDTYCHAVIVQQIAPGDCVAFFEYTQTPNSLSVHFFDGSESDHNITSWYWTFGDGDVSDNHAPTHIYDAPGTYEVCLTITDNTGCTDTYCHAVIVQQMPPGDCVAFFEYTQTAGTLSVHFFDGSESDHDITSWIWTFGDGHDSDDHTPTHIYDQPGTYEVCLTIHDNTGCEDTYCHVVIVLPVTPGDCEALFAWYQIQGTQTIHFVDSSFSNHDITSYSWNFGEGHEGDGQNPNHYFPVGTYEVCLTITDNTGCTDTYCTVVTVVPESPGECHALFNYEQFQNALTIHFNNQSTSNHDINSYQWSFGDGHGSDGQNPNHTYAAPGNYLVCLIIHDNTGCVDTFCLEITVNPVTPGDCHAQFEYEQFENNTAIHFINQSSSNHDITSYQWSFGDGHGGDGQNPNHEYDSAGTYLVCLIIHDNTGCVDTFCLEVSVEPVTPGECHAQFEYEQFENHQTIHFINQSSSNHDITSYQWSFGDGHGGDGQNPNHEYDSAGTYVVCLIIHDNTGCTDTFCLEVTVNVVTPGECEALFVWYQIQGTQTVHFVDSSFSNHDITSYSWNFGDGHEGDGQNPNHYFPVGTYEVCLTITDNTGCTDTYCTVVTVLPESPGECHALFNYEQFQNALTIHFNNQSTSDHDINSYQWSFGDGHGGDGQNPNHTYAASGNYLVCLIIHDNTGCVDTFCLEITVNPVTPGECHAQFEYEQFENHQTIHFINQSSSEHDITSYQWSFGDGHGGDGQNPNHEYDSAGTYVVCLIIHDNTGCIDTFCLEVVVEPVTPGICEAFFGWYQISGTQTIHFIDSSFTQGDITSYSWNFGDGHQGDGANPNHYFPVGTYEVCLTITDNTGCSDTYCTVVTVEPEQEGDCQALFTFQNEGGSLTVHFSNASSSSHDIISWLWTFGDGGVSDNPNPTHTYDQPGTYQVCLVIHDNTGCEDSYCISVTVGNSGEDCHAAFTSVLDSLGFTVTFTNTSTNTTPNTTYLWTFGDGTTSTQQNPVHTYDHHDNYTVCLIITDPSIDCVADVCHIVQVIHQGGFSESENFVKIYPNPAFVAATIEYELTAESDVDMELCNMAGMSIRQVSSAKESIGFHRHTVDAANLNAGLYVFKIRINQEVIIRKIIIAN